MTSESINLLKGNFPGPLTQAEKRLLQDMRAVINLALDYDLSMSFVAAIVNHDLDEIKSKGNLEKALLEGFLPKSDGYSGYPS